MKNNFFKSFLKLNIVFMLIVCTFSGCTDMREEHDTPRVVASNFAYYDFARAVCGDMADVKMIIRPGAEVHSYEPSLSDIMAIENADIFIYGGGESDEWIERILSSVNNEDMAVISCMDLEGVHLYEEQNHASNKGHEHHHKKGEKAYDEHIWTSPKNAMEITDAIKNILVDRDAENSRLYEENARKYIDILNEIDEDFSDLMDKSQNKFIAVADRFPFLYMAKDYGIEYMSAFSACSPESDAGPSVIAHMTEEIKLCGIDAVFHIELSNEKMADAICENTGAKKLLLHSCQSIRYEDFEKGVTYADIMKNNLINLREVLKS